MQDTEFDLVVIGGGITGSGCARDAALRGLKVILLEKNDFASATSSASTKLIHGGIRYLEFFDFPLVFEALRERNILLQTAPDYVSPLSFIYPIIKGAKSGPFKMRAGFALYGFLGKIAGKTSALLSHRLVTRKEFSIPGRNDINGGIIYGDAKMFDSALVLANIRDARKNGARCISYALVRDIKHTHNRFELSVYSPKQKKEYSIFAEQVLNCSGHWISGFRKKISSPAKIRLSQGIHIFTRRRLCEEALILPTNEKARYFFVIPRFGGTLVGTTETELSEKEVDSYSPHEEEIDSLLYSVNRNFPSANLKYDEISFAFAGIRTLIEKKNSLSTATISRRHLFEYKDGIYYIAGGKFTTYRKMAEAALDCISRHFPKSGPCLTKKISLSPPHHSLPELENPSYKPGDICPGHPVNFSDCDFYKPGREGGETERLSLSDLLIRRLLLPFTECRGKDCAHKIAVYMDCPPQEIQEYFEEINGWKRNFQLP